MKIAFKSFTLRNYKFELTNQAYKELTELSLIDEDGETSLGELSTFPTVHAEIHQFYVDELVYYLNLICGKSFTLQNFNNTSYLFNLYPEIKDKKISGPVLFAIEGALLSLINKKNQHFIQESFQLKKSMSSIPVNFFLPDQTTTAINGACYKIKIGRDSLHTDIHKINQLADTLLKHEKIQLRLDGNRLLTNRNLETIVSSIEIKHIEYLEEPLADYKQWNEFYQHHPIALALDESLDRQLKTVNKYSGVNTWVLKPTRFGISQTLALIQIASKKNINCVISSTYETIVGMKYNLLLAQIVSTQKVVPSGLDTIKCLPKKYQTQYVSLEGKIEFNLTQI